MTSILYWKNHTPKLKLLIIIRNHQFFIWLESSFNSVYEGIKERNVKYEIIYYYTLNLLIKKTITLLNLYSAYALSYI